MFPTSMHYWPTLVAVLLLLMTSHLARGLPSPQIDDVRVSLASSDGSSVIPTHVVAVSTTTAASTTRAAVKKQQPLHHQQQPISLSAENVIGPLENIADRFLKSETVGVVDSFAAQAIEVFARFVDNAGLAMVNIIDRLPTTIDRVADTVDGMVRTADNLGREVAVIVTAPARVVLTGLNPNFESTIRRRSSSSSSTSRFSSASDSRADASTKSEVQEKPISSGSQNRRQSLVSRLSRMTGQNSGQTNSLLRLFDPQQQQGRNDRPRERAVDRFRKRMRDHQNNSIETDLVVSSSVRRPSRTSSTVRNDSKEKKESTRRPNHPLSFLGFGALGTHFRNNNNRNNQNSSSDEREKSVFERNFEASRTQASIDRLEEEFGGFLGRLLGTIYRNADPIDSSLSEGLRRVLGTAPTTPRSSSIRSSSSGGSSGSSGKSSTTTTAAPIQFRLTFDDIDPAPARNSDLFQA